MSHPSGSRSCPVYQTWAKAQQIRHTQVIGRQCGIPVKVTEIKPDTKSNTLGAVQGETSWAGVVKRQLVQVLPDGSEQVVCKLPVVPEIGKTSKKTSPNSEKPTKLGQKLSKDKAHKSKSEFAERAAKLKTFWSGIKFFIMPWLQENPEVAKLVELLEAGSALESFLEFISQKHLDV